MVESLTTGERLTGPSTAARPLIVELVGPAGAGKTTLAAALGRRVPGIRCHRGVYGLPASDLFRGALHSMHGLPGLWGTNALHIPGAVRQVIRLQALAVQIGRESTGDDTVLILDEGPVFALAWLEVVGRVPVRDRRFARWRQRQLERWVRTLDLVVRLDAPDDTLAARIRSRGKPHPLKHAPDEVLHPFLCAYRRAYESIINGLTTRCGPRVLAVDAAQESAEETALRVTAVLREARGR